MKYHSLLLSNRQLRSSARHLTHPLKMMMKRSRGSGARRKTEEDRDPDPGQEIGIERTVNETAGTDLGREIAGAETAAAVGIVATANGIEKTAAAPQTVPLPVVHATDASDDLQECHKKKQKIPRLTMPLSRRLFQWATLSTKTCRICSR
jgi:hypothetical protein